MGIFFVVNPVAGKGKVEIFIEEIENVMRDKKIKYKIAYTQYPGHAIEIASKVDPIVYHKIISVGGDGTIYEVINGIKDTSLIFGILPTGTGNDLARTIGIPMDKREALDIILNEHTKLIDIGKFNGNFFINVAGVGLDVEVLKATNDFKKYIKGPIAYVLGLIKALRTFKAINLHMTIDGETYSKEVMVCAIGNGKYYGGGMKIVPTAQLEDGYFDICIIKKMSKLRLLSVFPRVFKGTHIELPWVELKKGKKVKIFTEKEILVNTDGEISKKTSPCFEVLEGRLNILVP